MKRQVTCVCRDPHGLNNCSSIYKLGGPGWSASVDEVVTHVESGLHHYYVIGRFGTRVDLHVVTPQYGKKYVRTDPNGTAMDNLLSLPRCPGC